LGRNVRRFQGCRADYEAENVAATEAPPRTALAPSPIIPTDRVEPPPRGWLSWLTTTDHKRIGVLYFVTSFVFFALGGTEALLMRLQLGTPDNTLLSPQTYNALVTMHGTTMVFLFVVPIMAGFGNYFVPLMIGARDMAFPKLNALSYWLFLAGGIVFYASVFWSPTEVGWTTYAPLSSKVYSEQGGVDAWIFLIHLTGLSSLIGSVNFYATIVNMRAPGMGWGRLPLFAWSILVFSVLLILSLPVVGAGATMLLAERHWGADYFDPAQGGDPLLWQHVFWFFGHPEVYIMILPGFGIISEVLPVFARKPIFGYKAVAAATAVIGFLALLVWFHHMFTTPSPAIVAIFFMLSSYLIGIPTGIKIFNWVATLWRGTIEFRTPLLFAVGFISVFLMGGVTGIFLATFPVDWQLHDTYFVVAHFHYVLVGGAIFAIFAGIYYWFPKVTGRMMSESLGKASCLVMFIGFNLTFAVQHAIGLEGMPRRVYEYPDIRDLHVLNVISSVGAFMFGLGILMTVVNLVRAARNGPLGGADPWKGNTLEWLATSPPPVNNFDAVPRVRSVEPMKDVRREIERLTPNVVEPMPPAPDHAIHG
jgi:cytochrome c oxidase subunit 1